MLDRLLWNLQLFADGADGGDGTSGTGEGSGLAEDGGENIPSSIPPRARENYKKALAKHSGSTTEVKKDAEVESPSEATHVAYSDLIKSDEYKEEHKAYMDKTIGDRLKKYKGIEADYGKARGILEIIAGKYGLDASSEGFLDELQQKAEADDSYYEDYAMEHDVSPEEARKIVTMERKVSKIEAQEKERERQAAEQQHIQRLYANAEATKRQFPDFDLDAEMENEAFRRLCAATNGDTTAAYKAIHFDSLMNTQVKIATQQAQQMTANAVKANIARPMESGLTSQAASVVTEDFSKMNLQQLRAYAEEQRRKQRR